MSRTISTPSAGAKKDQDRSKSLDRKESHVMKRRGKIGMNGAQLREMTEQLECLFSRGEEAKCGPWPVSTDKDRDLPDRIPPPIA